MRQLDQFRRRAARYLEIEPVTVAPARGLFSLSFDDFPESAWSVAGPILADHGVLATYYVCGGLERGTNLDLPQFTTDQLQALHAAGHEVGCHTFGHDSVLRLDGPALADSLDRNARWVAERLGGYRMQTFAYPFGDASVGAKRALRSRFDLARSVREGLNLGREDRMLIKSFGMERRRLPGYDLEAMMAETADKVGWLTAYAHDVSDHPTPYGCTPADLDRVLTLAKQAGLAILPVGQAWAECGGARPRVEGGLTHLLPTRGEVARRGSDVTEGAAMRPKFIGGQRHPLHRYAVPLPASGEEMN